MAVRQEIFSGKEIKVKSEDILFYPQTNAHIKTNGKRVLNEDDLLSGGITIMDPVGITPNDDAAIITGSHLELEPCDETHPGVLVVGVQNLSGGNKTLNGDFICLKRLRVPNTTSTTVGLLEFEGASKRMRLHNFALSAASANVFLGMDAGNFTNDGQNNIGFGRDALKLLDVAEDTIALNSGGAVTNASRCILLNGGRGITTSHNVVAIGTRALNVGSTNVNDTIAIGTNAASDCTFALKTTVIGVDSAPDATDLDHATIFGGDNCSSCTDVINSIVLGGDNVQSTLEIDDCFLMGNFLSGGATDRLAHCIFIGASPSSTIAIREDEIRIGDNNHNKVYFGGIQNPTFEGTPSPLSMVTQYDNNQLVAHDLPGATGWIHQGITASSFVDNSIGNVIAFSGTVGSNDYFHTVGNTIVVDQPGSIFVTVRFHSIIDNVNYLCSLLLDGINANSCTCTLGTRVTGLQATASFDFQINATAGLILSWTLAGKANTGTPNNGCDGTGGIELNFVRNIPQ